MANLSIRYRIYPDEEQKDFLAKTFGCCRQVYNYILGENIKYYRLTGKNFDQKENGKLLTAYKRLESFAYLNEVESQSLIKEFQCIQTAFKNFKEKKNKKFNSKRKAKDIQRGINYKHNDEYLEGFPNFKRKFDLKNRSAKFQIIDAISAKVRKQNELLKLEEQTHRYNGRINSDESTIKIPKYKMPIRAVLHKLPPKGAELISVTITHEPDDTYHASCNFRNYYVEELPKTGNDVGFDLGLKDLIISTDGEKFDHQKFRKKSENKIARLQRKQKRKERINKEKGEDFRSSNYKKISIKIAKNESYVRRKRKDYNDKLSKSFVERYDFIGLETLAVKNMMKKVDNSEIHEHNLNNPDDKKEYKTTRAKSGRNKSIADAGWSSLVTMIKYKAELYGKTVVQISQWYPSSKTCSNECGYKADKLPLVIRRWTCPKCGTKHDRDFNAAKNILAEAKRNYFIELDRLEKENLEKVEEIQN